ARASLAEAEAARDAAAQEREAAEAARHELAQRVASIRLEVGRLEGELNLAAERLANFETRRVRAADERAQMEARAHLAGQELAAAIAEREDATAEHARIQEELSARAAREEESRARLQEARGVVRQTEQELQAHLQKLRSLEGERTALEGELQSLRERSAQAAAHRSSLQGELVVSQRRRDHLVERAGFEAYEARRAADTAERARHLVAETREHEALQRAARRQAEESLAQLTARRHALEELERDRVGLAPAAAALLAARGRFGDAVLGPLSDFVTAGREGAEIAERLLGEWMHAVLVRDERSIAAIQAWHAEHQPGALVLLPIDPGPAVTSGVAPSERGLEVSAPAEPWVRAALAGSEVLDTEGRVLRRASGAIFLSGGSAPSGPLRRRAELATLIQDVTRAEEVLESAGAALAATTERLGNAERELAEAAASAEAARETERQAVAAREDAIRLLANLSREFADSEAQVARITDRLTASEKRLAEIDAFLLDGERSGAQLDASLGAGRSRLAELEAEQESVREARAQWQVQEAHVAARLRSASERAERTERTRSEAAAAIERLSAELDQLAVESAELAARRSAWAEEREAATRSLTELDGASAAAERAVAAAAAALAAADRSLHELRAQVEAFAEESHAIDIRLTEAAGLRRGIRERVETEWRKPLEQLVEGLTLLDLDFETLEAEAERILSALEAIGPVNALAVEEHAEESKRLEFLIAQRDDLVSARQSLIQAIREIDGTARELFLQTFTAVQANFQRVFTTLFGGGECELRLATPEDPLESEIEIHAAPRGKRTQRIHLLSSGERTLVAVSLLFSIYLTKPSPFCLMDEVDAPLDDANVGRFTRLLDEFKLGTQFLVITHNPRTMQSADAVYGVTMQEPGVSTIVGVRLGEREVA
ncbi:MAG TPA: AAA family ATPase, partial [Gemmatimonadales bacterium]